MNVIQVPVEEAREMVYGDSAIGTIVESRITGTSRWSVHHEAIIRYKGKDWKVTYSVGATEAQDERPFEYDNTAEFVEVRAVSVQTIAWVPV
jgi:hypothetical protein